MENIKLMAIKINAACFNNMEVDKIDLRELSSFHDEMNRNVFISIYLNMAEFDLKFIDKRLNECMKVVDNGIVKENFRKSMRWIHDYLDEEVESKGLAIFASYIKNFFVDYAIDSSVKNMLVLNSSPYVKPLAELKDEYEEYGLVLISDEITKIISVYADSTYEKMGEYILRKYLHGGWAEEVAYIANRGDEEKFMERIKNTIDSMKFNHVVIASSFHADKELLNSFFDSENIAEIIGYNGNILSGNEIRRSIFTDAPLLYDIEDILNGIKNGEVEMVLIKNKLEGWKCKRCNILRLKNGECPICHGVMDKVEIGEEISNIGKENIVTKFTDDEIVSRIGGIIAFLKRSKRH